MLEFLIVIVLVFVILATIMSLLIEGVKTWWRDFSIAEEWDAFKTVMRQFK